jgi:hypothetical protein
MICMLHIIEKSVRGSMKKIILFKGVYVGKRLGTPGLNVWDMVYIIQMYNVHFYIEVRLSV